MPDGQRLSILLLCDNNRSHANTLLDHIAAFTELSAHDIYIFNPRFLKNNRLLDLDEFDAIVIHYSLLIIHDTYLAPAFRQKIKDYKGLKIQCIQDDYRWVDQIAAMIRFLGMHVLFTLYPTDTIARVWDASRLPGVASYSTLAGYIPDSLLTIMSPPFETRPLDIGYRGRVVPYWLGEFAQEKAWIAKGVLDRADRYGLRCNIAWREEDRIYGKDWIGFICSCKAMLGTESGTSITDFDGSVQKKTDEYLAQHPGADFFEVQREVLLPYENNLPIKVISPRMFESIALRTALILFPGDYSGILQPWVHYIPLERDFSNMEQVVEKLHDTAFMKSMIQRAYDDIVASGSYSYRAFIEEFDAIVNRHKTARAGRTKSKLFYRLAHAERALMHFFSMPPVHPKNYVAPKNILYIFFLFSYFIRNGLYSILEKAYGWLLLLRTLFWTSIVFQDGLPRKILSLYFSAGSSYDPASLKNIVKDLLRLGIIRKIQKSELGPFQIRAAYDAGKKSILFTSINKGGPLVEDALLSADEKIFWSAFHEACKAGCIDTMLWDHTAITAPLHHPVFRCISFPVEKNGADRGFYHFEALVTFIQTRQACK